MLEKSKTQKKVAAIILVVLILILWSERKILTVSTSPGYRLLELFFTFCMLISLTAVINYLLFEQDSKLTGRKIKLYYIFLLGVHVVAFLPLYTQNFMYGDDLWGFASSFDGQLSGGLYFSRPFINFLLGPLQNTSFLYIKYFRLYNGLILYLFGCVLFRYLISKNAELHLAFFISSVAIGACFAVDCVAYASIYPINISLLLSAIFFVFYIKARESTEFKKLYYLVSMVSLLSAFCMYQIGTTIVFLFYLISEKADMEKKEIERFKKAFLYLIFYGLVAIIYLLTNKFWAFVTGISAGQNARSELNLSIDNILFKLKWFTTEVIPQAFTRTTGAIWGNSLFNENNMFYKCTYTQKSVSILFMFIMTVLVLIFIVFTAYKKRSFVYLLISIVAIPLSFWPFLVLPESYFLTYYALGIILLFVWMLIGGTTIIVHTIFVRFKVAEIRVKKFKNVFISVLTVIIVLQSNNYAENSWVNYCRDSYEYLANSITTLLSENKEINTIYVQGNIGPYVGGRDYVIFCVENILKEIGRKSDDYNILQSDNGNYVLTFNDNEIDHMLQVLGQDKMDKLLKYYFHDDMYSRWCYLGTANDEESINFLKNCFIQTNQLVQINEKVGVISMYGFNIRNPF